MKCDIMKRWILILFVDQPISSLGTTRFLIQMWIKKYIYLINLLKIFSLTLYHMRMLVMIEIPPWITSKIKGLIQEKNITKKCYFPHSKNIQLLPFRISNVKNRKDSLILLFRISYYIPLQAWRHTGQYWNH